MAQQILDVIIKAGDLMEYSMRVTSNRKRYPAKYIQLVNRIQNKSMDIYEYLLDANRTRLDTLKTKRLELQTKAVTTCDKISRLIEMSMNLNIIGSDTVAHWQKLIEDVKYMTIAWREKDRNR